MEKFPGLQSRTLLLLILSSTVPEAQALPACLIRLKSKIENTLHPTRMALRAQDGVSLELNEISDDLAQQRHFLGRDRDANAEPMRHAISAWDNYIEMGDQEPVFNFVVETNLPNFSGYRRAKDVVSVYRDVLANEALIEVSKLKIKFLKDLIEGQSEKLGTTRVSEISALIKREELAIAQFMREKVDSATALSFLYHHLDRIVDDETCPNLLCRNTAKEVKESLASEVMLFRRLDWRGIGKMKADLADVLGPELAALLPADDLTKDINFEEVTSLARFDAWYKLPTTRAMVMKRKWLATKMYVLQVLMSRKWFPPLLTKAVLLIPWKGKEISQRLAETEWVINAENIRASIDDFALLTKWKRKKEFHSDDEWLLTRLGWYLSNEGFLRTAMRRDDWVMRMDQLMDKLRSDEALKKKYPTLIKKLEVAFEAREKLGTVSASFRYTGQMALGDTLTFLAWAIPTGIAGWWIFSGNEEEQKKALDEVQKLKAKYESMEKQVKDLGLIPAAE